LVSQAGPRRRKAGVRREGKHWVLHVTPEAVRSRRTKRGTWCCTGKSSNGFPEFCEKSKEGYLFIDPKPDELGVGNAVKTARNKVNTFVREVVKDPHVDPSHGWRHRFKTVGIEQEVEMRVLDAIQGHAPRNAALVIRQGTSLAKRPEHSARRNMSRCRPNISVIRFKTKPPPLLRLPNKTISPSFTPIGTTVVADSASRIGRGWPN
jgi:hypothetical protein